VWCLCCPAEFALLRLFAKEQAERGGPSFADGKPLVHAVYVAPLEALVAEKYAEWSEKLGKTLGIKIAKLTGATRKPLADLGLIHFVLSYRHSVWDVMVVCWQCCDKMCRGVRSGHGFVMLTATGLGSRSLCVVLQTQCVRCDGVGSAVIRCAEMSRVDMGL
jgi:hypothetical protein